MEDVGSIGNEKFHSSFQRGPLDPIETNRFKWKSTFRFVRDLEKIRFEERSMLHAKHASVDLGL